MTMPILDAAKWFRNSGPIRTYHYCSITLVCATTLGPLACSSAPAPNERAGTGVTASGGASPGAAGSVAKGGSRQATTSPASAGSTAQGGFGGGAPQGGSGDAWPTGGASQAGGSAQAGAGGEIHLRDHCVEGYDPDPSDSSPTMNDGPVEFIKSGQIDLIVQPEVLEWMKKGVWEQAHFQWHNIRRCAGGLMGATDDPAGGGVNPCLTHKDLVPLNQEGKGPGDGLEFLAMHRHMIESMKQLWPKHAQQFEGWEHFPTKASDVPPQWQAAWSAWPANIAEAAAKADDPASHMNEPGFESEGAFGQWIQTTTGLHGALHFKWVRSNNSEHGLGNQFTNVDNYMFWKMHGWIDNVWDRYRAAQGKTPHDQDIRDAVLAQCRQMDQLAVIVKPELGSKTCSTPAPKQSGVFAETIRPIFESQTNKCTGCHGPTGPSANLTLGGGDCVKSSDIVSALVNRPSTKGGQFKLVEPGDPDKSWLYLKVTGKAATAGCVKTGSAECLSDSMPYGVGVTLTQAEQDALRKWIADGAVAPQ